ncbi:hypothetical protein [Streptomyces sp. WMMC905]|uniref:hypothetical protein n=1 Tax=Streptomyces sp. WMMC905 TaxID=3404123 RepID=UPI003B9329AE
MGSDVDVDAVERPGARRVSGARPPEGREVPGRGRLAAERGGAVDRLLWTEESARAPRVPDSVRDAAVRALLVVAVSLVQAMVAVFCALAGSWLAFPAVILGVVGTVVATWAVLDVWVTRQVWKQRHGVVSAPSSTARPPRGGRRGAGPGAREGVRGGARGGGAERLSRR